MDASRHPPVPTAEEPTLWVLLHESPFEGEWVGLTHDWAERLPCSPVELAWARLWICLTAPSESALSSQLLEVIGAELRLQHERNRAAGA